MFFQVTLWAIVVAVVIYLFITDQSNSPRWERWIPAVFFLSGLPALAYQIVWQRALFVVFGSNVQSVTIIVTLFILGLGIGSLISGWATARVKSHLRIFGFLELCVGIFGAASTTIFQFVSSYSAKLSVPETVIMVSLVLLPPTMLMGATLPMLVTHISIRDPISVGRSVAKLYFVNTLGSAIACFICAQFAMYLLGQRKMTFAAATLNIFIATFVLTRKRRAETDPPPVPPTVAASIQHSLSLTIALLLAFFTGFIALSYELIWYRIFSFADGGQASGFAYVLGAYLGGLAYGALLAEVRCRKAEEQGQRIGIGTVGTLVVLFNIIAFLVAPTLGLAERLHGLGVLGLFIVAFAAGCLGSIFPLLANTSVDPGKKIGAGLGTLYFANMVGAACGSFLVGYVIFDFLSLRWIALSLLLAGLACGLTLTAATGKLKESVTAGVVIAVVCVAFTPALFDHLYEKLLFKSYYLYASDFKYLVENRNGVISVTADGTVFGGGAYDGAFNTELVPDANHVDRCFALSSFVSSPRTVLMIGLSSGSWAQILASHPMLETLDVVEINPGYLQLIPKYPQVASVLKNPKVRIYIDDGRRWLRRNPDKKYDLIVMNTTFYWRANSTNLLSVEFLRLVRQHLKKAGVFFYNTTGSGDAQLTGTEVFPYALRVANFLAVSDDPIVLDRERLRKVLLEYRIDGRPAVDLSQQTDRRELDEILRKVAQPVNYGEDKDFFSFEYRDSIRRRQSASRIMTDDNMGGEWPK